MKKYIGHISHFSGAPGEEGEEWMDQFEALAEQNQWNTRNVRRGWLVTFLTGMARQWYENLTIANDTP